MTSERKKTNILELQKMKRDGRFAAWITAYDLPLAQAAEQAGVDMILVGDSGGMVQLGYQTTNPVTMDEMIILAKAARRGAPNTFIIGDMPQGSYEPSDRDAIQNALRFIKEAGCDAIKLEGGKRMASRIKAIVDAGILVMGHLGLTPQSAQSFGGYRVQAKTVSSFEETMDDARALQETGIFSLLLEAIPTEPAGQIARQLKIPIYGIGAGSQVDGQLVIMHDLLGFYQSFRPWFAKCYVPGAVNDFAKHLAQVDDLKKMGREQRMDGLFALARMAVERYVQDVRSGAFPGEEYSYPLKADELKVLQKSKYWKTQ
jgi:3-methyl-2-oxobutanoate hydroxymethyltransferase